MIPPMDFEQLVNCCQMAHEETKRRTSRAIDSSLVVRNWLFGLYIVEFEQLGTDRARYGARLVDELAVRLRELGVSSVSPTRLRLYRTFYREFQRGSSLFRNSCMESDENRIQPTSSVESTTLDQASSNEPSDDFLLVSTKRFSEALSSISKRFTLGWSHYVELLTSAMLPSEVFTKSKQTLTNGVYANSSDKLPVVSINDLP